MHNIMRLFTALHTNIKKDTKLYDNDRVSREILNPSSNSYTFYQIFQNLAQDDRKQLPVRKYKSERKIRPNINLASSLRT